VTLRASRRIEFIRSICTPWCKFSFAVGVARPHARGGATKGSSIHTSLQVGKYLISPIIRRLDSDRFAASVSIRSGRGSMTLDRVLRFVPDFGSHDQAAHFATEQALSWIAPGASLISIPQGQS